MPYRLKNCPPLSLPLAFYKYPFYFPLVLFLLCHTFIYIRVCMYTHTRVLYSNMYSNCGFLSARSFDEKILYPIMYKNMYIWPRFSLFLSLSVFV